MALQSSFYNTDGTTRTYPSTKHIATKQHVAVYFKDAVTNVWLIASVSLYSLVNNSIVFDISPDNVVYSQIEVRVADDSVELEDSPSDIALVAGSIANVNIIATDIANINTVATNIASVSSVSGSITNVNTTATNIASVQTASSNISSINDVAGSIIDVNSVASTVVPNIAEILLADDNATTATAQAGIATAQATNAQLRAWEAEAEKLTSDSYSTEGENVFVKAYTSNGDGTFTVTNTTDYSSYHWYKQAEAIGGLTIDATPTDGSSNPVASNGVFDSLALKSDTSHTHSYLPLAGGTMTGAITALRETKVAMGANGIDLSAGNLFTKTISGATTLTVSNWLASGNANSFILELTNGGSAAITWFSGVKWASGTAPTLTASGVDILGFYSHDGGTTVRGIVLSKDSK